MATSKLLESPYSHIKGNSVLKACWADMPYVCWGEHWMGNGGTPKGYMTRVLVDIIYIAMVRRPCISYSIKKNRMKQGGLA